MEAVGTKFSVTAGVAVADWFGEVGDAAGAGA